MKGVRDATSLKWLLRNHSMFEPCNVCCIPVIQKALPGGGFRGLQWCIYLPLSAMGNFQHLEEDPVTGFCGIISSMQPLRNQQNLVHCGNLCCAYIWNASPFQANCFQFWALYHEDVPTKQHNAETFGRTSVMSPEYV